LEKQTTFVNCQRAAYSIQKSKHIWGFKVWLEWLRLKKNKHVFGLVLQGYDIKSGDINKHVFGLVLQDYNIKSGDVKKHVFGLVLQGYNIKSGAVNKGDLLRKSDIKISHNIDRHK
jgi:hypothetical protein